MIVRKPPSFSMDYFLMLYFLICENGVYYKHKLIIRIHSGLIRIMGWQGARYEIIVRFREGHVLAGWTGRFINVSVS